MPLDTSSYYPVTPGSSCDPEGDDPRSEKEVEATPSTATESETQRQQSQRAAVYAGVPDPDPSEPERVADGIATALSWILVPLLMPLYGTILIFNESILAFTSAGVKWRISLIIAGITILVPMILVWLLKRVGVVNDIGLNKREERFIPYVITILSMAGSGWFMLSRHAPEWVGMFYMGGAVAALICLIVNFRWKISAHGAGIAGIVALLVRMGGDGLPHPGLLTWLVVWVALSGLVGASRVWLGRHTVWQVIAGFAIGYASVMLMTLI